MAIANNGHNLDQLQAFMAHPDIPQAVKDGVIARGPGITAAHAIADEFAGILGPVAACLDRIRGRVKGRRQAVAAELGDDAKDFLTVYNHLKQAVEIGRGIELEGLPDE